MHVHETQTPAPAPPEPTDFDRRLLGAAVVVHPTLLKISSLLLKVWHGMRSGLECKSLIMAAGRLKKLHRTEDTTRTTLANGNDFCEKRSRPSGSEKRK
jgi:hypothetical protein